MFWRLVVDSPSDQEIRKVSLEGEYFNKENWYYGLKRKGGLVIGVTWELFKVPIKISKSVWQVTWSKVNRYAKLSGSSYQDDGTTRWSKEESKDEVSLSPSRHLPNLGDEIHLKGGRIVTP